MHIVGFGMPNNSSAGLSCRFIFLASLSIVFSGFAQSPEPPSLRTISDRSFRLNPAGTGSTNVLVTNSVAGISLLTPPDPRTFSTNRTLRLPPPPMPFKTNPPQPPEGMRQIPVRSLKLNPIVPFQTNGSSQMIPPPVPQPRSSVAERELAARQGELMRNYRTTLMQEIRKNPRTGMAYAPDPRELTFSNSILRWESMLADTNLSPTMRESYLKLIEKDKERLIEVQQDAVYWRAARNAVESRDKAKIAEAEQALANHLIHKLEKYEGKTYPTNLTLEEVGELYKEHSEARKKEKEKEKGAKEP